MKTKFERESEGIAIGLFLISLLGIMVALVLAGVILLVGKMIVG